MKLGKFEIFVVSDGTFRLDGGTMFGVIPRVMWSKSVSPDDQNMTRWGTNCLLILSGDKKILMETGMGMKLSERQLKIYGRVNGNLLEKNLNALGFRVEDIDLVIPTHLHIDHSGGFTVIQEGRLKPRFPHAKYLLQRLEWEAATHPTRLNRATYLAENFVPVVEAHQVEWLDGDAEVMPGLRVIRTGGHTQGHQAVRITSEGENLFCPGDLVPSRWHMRQTFLTAYDLGPCEVMESKSKWLGEAMEEDWMIHWYHDPECSFGRVGMDGENFIARDFI